MTTNFKQMRVISPISLGDKRAVSQLRVVLANVPLVPVFVPGKHANAPSVQFSFWGPSECTLVLVFVPGEHPPKPPFWKTTLSATPDNFA